ncbi:N4-gp56 family major capsid protein [bacterium]|nr:N4-gp56 family major capsid protein [bacterium]
MDYEKVFLERAEYELVLKEGAQMRTHPVNEGRTVNFTRYTPLTIITDPLGELSNPVTCAITACTVAMTLSEYGLTTIHSKLLTLVSIDSSMKEKVELVGQNMGEVLNRLVRAELQNGTSFYGNGHSVSTFTAGDTLDACDIRQITKALEIAKARPYKDGMFIGKTDPISKYNLIGDTTWVNAKTYSDVKDLYKGEMGELYQVRWLLNKDVSSGTEATSTASSGVIRYYTYVHGDNSFGCYDLSQDKPRLYILPNQVDSNSPAGRVSYVSWAGSYAVKLLNSDWVQACRFALV